MSGGSIKSWLCDLLPVSSLNSPICKKPAFTASASQVSLCMAKGKSHEKSTSGLLSQEPAGYPTTQAAALLPRQRRHLNQKPAGDYFQACTISSFRHAHFQAWPFSSTECTGWQPAEKEHGAESGSTTETTAEQHGGPLRLFQSLLKPGHSWIPWGDLIANVPG